MLKRDRVFFALGLIGLGVLSRVLDAPAAFLCDGDRMPHGKICYLEIPAKTAESRVPE
jgi:hypothetical protein